MLLPPTTTVARVNVKKKILLLKKWEWLRAEIAAKEVKDVVKLALMSLCLMNDVLFQEL